MNGTMASQMVSFVRPCEGGGACVEVGRVEAVAVRDSKNPEGPVLVFDATEWREFVIAVKAGEFDFS